MPYRLEPLTEAIWHAICPAIPDRLLRTAQRQGLADCDSGNGIAFSEHRDSWLCRAPVMIRDRSYAWYMFHFEQQTFCLRVLSPSDALVEWIEPQEAPGAEVQVALVAAFQAYGFYGLPDSPILPFAPRFPPASQKGPRRWPDC